MERLSILKKLNVRLLSIPEIYGSPDYWGLIKRGMANIDQAPRKIALNILKENLSAVSNTRQLIDAAEFELMWTTFFDVMDTLDSFGSHLLKAVWHRVDIFYDYILKYKQAYNDGTTIHPLEDFREWLLVIYNRVNSHSNMKIRRHIVKETLKRPFMTTCMKSFLFGTLMKMLNLGLLFKDITFYCAWSKHSESVV